MAKYLKQFAPPANLTLIVLEDVYRTLGAADVFHIHCGENEFYDVKALLDKTLYNQPRFPFYPIINLSMDFTLEKREWYIEAHYFDRAEIKSIGCVAF